jgi:hypothetical protein
MNEFSFGFLSNKPDIYAEGIADQQFPLTIFEMVEE